MSLLSKGQTPLRRFAAPLAAALLCLGLVQVAAAEDHNGADITIIEDTEWTGLHTGIRTLVINEAATLRAAPGEILRIQAETVEVYGVLTSDSGGMAGGTSGDRGRGGLGGSGTGAGSNGADGEVCGRPGIDYNAGGGGGGGASFIGRGGRGGAGADANDGGCQGAFGGNAGPNTSDLTPRFGAGGGGGGGAGGRRNARGTDGGLGGGILIIEAKTLRVEGRISSNGASGGTGGTSPDFFHGGGGGGGASGGTVQVNTTFLVGGGIIEARGGSGGNGGQGDRVDSDSFTGAGGGGGGGGLVILEFSNRNAFTGQCLVTGGSPGAGQNTNGQAGEAGTDGRCVDREVNGRPTADPGGPYIGVEGRAVLLDGSNSSDPDGDELTIEWDCDNDGNFETEGVTAECTYRDNGTYLVRLRVEDPEGSEDTTFFEIIVTEGPPAAALTGPERIDEGQSVTFDASASDGFGDAITEYAWDYDYDGTFVADATTEVPSSTTDRYCDNGVFTVAVRVTDEGGSTALALHRVIVTNVEPTVSNIASEVATEGVDYTHTIEVADPGCDTFTYTFIARPEGMEIDENGTVTFQPTFRQALEGETAVRVLISDDDFGRTTYEWVLRVGFTDEDEDGLPDTWELFFGLNPRSPVDARQDPDADGRNNLTEFQNNTNPTEFDGPTQPRLSSPRDGAEVDNVTPLLRSFRAQSPLGDDLTYEVEVYDYVEDETMLQPDMLRTSSAGLVAPNNSPSFEYTVTEDATLEDHTSYCWRARATDSLVPGPWSELWCFFVNLDNEPPTPPTILLPEHDSQLDNALPSLVVGNCTDPDNDPLTYTFILYQGDGLVAPVDSAAGLPEGEDGMTTWEIEGELEENEKYCWRVQCRDNEGQASNYSDIGCFFINRQNELPNAPVIIAPVALEGEDRATVRETPVKIVVRNSTDPEGDALAYTFQLDTSINFDSPDLIEEEIAEFNGGETDWLPDVEWADNTVYFARVRASDGQGSSPFAVVEFFLNFENDAPTAPTLRSPVNSTVVFTRQPTLTVVNSLDPDGDRLRYTYEIYADADLNLPIDRRRGVEETPETTQYRIVSTQLADGTYYWRAFAEDAEDISMASELGVFIVRASGPGDPNPDPNPGPDPTNPEVPGGTDPGDCDCTQIAGKSSPSWPFGALFAAAAIGLAVLRRRA